MPWAIFYDSGRTFTDEDGTWDEAPSEGVLVVVEVIGERTTLHSGHDNYQLEEDGTIVMRDARTLIAAIGRLTMSTVKFGRYTSNTNMERALERARQCRR
jgi:hypothetical protein